MADTRPNPTHPIEPLTGRELEILACLDEGLTNQEIANRLYLSEKTVRWYNTRIYDKLGAKDRAEAVVRAKLLGLFGAPATARGIHNLPTYATPFVGRQRELAELAALLGSETTRLVTILAPGGMGKTRLSVEAGRAHVGRSTDGVYFVPMAPLGAPDDIVTAIAEAIGMAFHGQHSPAKQLAEFLKDRDMLLVLDNFEHLLAGALLVTDIVQAAPRVKVLATSREKLNLSAETTYALSGLRAGDSEAQDDAATLFIQGARRVRPEFAVQTSEVEPLRRICRLTAGMPLGIELAAGWLDILSLEQIAAEIQRGIDILETDLRDVPERHRSVRATFERTWERLDAVDQSIFARLSVFRGGFTLDAAQAVAGATARHLRGLSQKALIQVEGSGRFAIHELLRQFGAGEVTEDALAAAQSGHADFFTEFMEQREQDIRTSRQFHAVEMIDRDFENIRTAWLYLVRRGEWEQLRPFLYPLWSFCTERPRAQEAVELLEAALNAVQLAPVSPLTELTRGRLLAQLGWAYDDIGFSQRGADAGDEALRILRQYPDRSADLAAACRNRQFSANSLRHLDISAAVSQEGLELARKIGDAHLEGHLLIVSAVACLLRQENERAMQCAAQGFALLQSRGDQGLTAYVVLGEAHFRMSQLDQTKRLLEQASTEAERHGNFATVGINHTRLGAIAREERDFATARRHLRIALHWYWTTHRWVAPFAIVNIAQLFADQNDADRAIEILAAVDPHLIVLRDTDKLAHALRAELEARVGPERFAAAWARGAAQELSAAVAGILAEFADVHPSG